MRRAEFLTAGKACKSRSLKEKKKEVLGEYTLISASAVSHRGAHTGSGNVAQELGENAGK